MLGGLSTAVLANGDRGSSTRSGSNPDLNDPKISGDFDYGVCRGTNPKCYHDWAHEERDDPPRVLIYTRTAGPRHANLGPRLAAGLNPPLTPEGCVPAPGVSCNDVQHALIRWLKAKGVEADWTEDVTRITNLHRYRAVIFASTSRDTLFAHG
ncbi:MAG TPA: hypothetical protein VIG70_13690, partial [Burkholderiales bacterium]